jgi:hypothetical protein
MHFLLYYTPFSKIREEKVSGRKFEKGKGKR